MYLPVKQLNGSRRRRSACRNITVTSSTIGIFSHGDVYSDGILLALTVCAASIGGEHREWKHSLIYLNAESARSRRFLFA